VCCFTLDLLGLAFNFSVVTSVSSLFCIFWNWRALPLFTNAGFYPGDSIYTLATPHGIALAGLTFVLLFFASYVSWRATHAVLHRFEPIWPIAIVGAVLNVFLILLLYWVLLSVMPQFYYMIYLQIFPYLPTQWVVKGLIPVKEFIELLSFSTAASLSVHAAGLLGWILTVNAMFQWLLAVRNPNIRTD